MISPSNISRRILFSLLIVGVLGSQLATGSVMAAEVLSFHVQENACCQATEMSCCSGDCCQAPPRQQNRHISVPIQPEKNQLDGKSVLRVPPQHHPDGNRHSSTAPGFLTASCSHSLVAQNICLQV